MLLVTCVSPGKCSMRWVLLTTFKPLGMEFDFNDQQHEWGKQNKTKRTSHLCE